LVEAPIVPPAGILISGMGSFDLPRTTMAPADSTQEHKLTVTAGATAEHLVSVQQRAYSPPPEIGAPGVSDALEERVVPASPYQDGPDFSKQFLRRNPSRLLVSRCGTTPR